VFIVPGVGQMCGYTDLEDWKLVLKADAELVSKRALLAKEKERTANLALQVGTLAGQVGKCAGNQEVLTERNSKLTQDLIKKDKLYQNERVKPRWGSPVAWTIAGLSTSVLAGIMLKAWLIP
jgi:hypothetical protein